ncbi:MAG: hypothetical protein WEA56_02975 [Balneolaceae bacterium]
MNKSTNKARDSIIYLPAISRTHSTDSIDAMANRLAGAFDRNAQSGDTEFYVKKEAREEFREFNTSLLTIMQKGDQDIPVADLYELDYRDLLISSAKERPPALHLLSILWSCLGMIPRLLSAIRRTGKTSLEKWQVFYAWLMALVVSLYFFILAGAFYSIASEASALQNLSAGTEISQAVEENNVAAGSNPDVSEQDGTFFTGTLGKVVENVSMYLEVIWQKVLPWIPSTTSVVVILAGFGFLSKKDFKKLISDLGIELAAAENYLSVDKKRGKIRGQFASLLEHISEKGSYDKIHIVSYSFGSVIAIDALFPNDNPLVPRFRLINTLTTIGTPYDFINTYWPKYFKNRMQYEGVPKNWVNIYMKSDVFGSNFTDAESGEARGIEFHPDYTYTDQVQKTPDINRISGPNRSLKEYGWFNRVKLIGFKTHSRYWEDNTGFDVNSIDIVVQELYKSNLTPA